ncbi:hypothetical protein [Streptomyces longwoodensis]|uniref:hypothetical protein n=1 Tax=Streptomyces longwoodensis TaxID=68231 RepID=UPI0036E53E08
MRMTTKYADFEGLRQQAVALRRAGLSRRQIRDRLHVDNNDILNRLLEGEPPPDWTKRPRAKDDLRARARELRLQGRTYDQIQLELGVSKSSISLWVRDLPKPERRPLSEQSRHAARERCRRQQAVREEQRRRITDEAAQTVGALSARELFLLGVGLYWSEGAKAKGGSDRRVIFVNSDPNMIRVFLVWLDLIGVERERLRFSVNIHESADVSRAEAYWAKTVGIETSALLKTSLKRHNPKTRRTNVGDSYRGCLRVVVLRSAELHRRVEGWWNGIVLGSQTSSGKV